MKNILFPTVATVLVLSGCAQQTTSIQEQNMNPLSATRYEEELANTLANFIIQKEKFTEVPGVAEKLQKYIVKAKNRLADADDILNAGMKGPMLSMKVTTTGYAALIGTKLYFSTDFETKPGINLHVYITEAVDPRDVEFPDSTAIDLGEIQTPYGAQVYDVPRQKKKNALRTVVLWDKELKLLYSFGQLSQ